MKNFLLFFLFSCSCSLWSQKGYEEIITKSDSLQRALFTIPDEKDIIKSSEEVLADFYENHNDIKQLEPMMSFRFYKSKPFATFKEEMEAKKLRCGKFVEMKIISTEAAADNTAVFYTLQITFEKTTTKEQVVLIKERKLDHFKVFEYSYK